MASATARFSVTMGLDWMRSSTPYRARICGQSVSAAVGASSWTAAIAACSWYGPDRALPQGGADQRHALGDGLPVPPAAVLPVERDQLAVRAGAGRPAGVGEQHQGEQAGHVGLVGQEPGAGRG